MNRKLLIDGREVTGNAGPRVLLNPADSSEIGTVEYADKKQIVEAVSAAQRAFDLFRKSASYERSTILRKCSEGLASRKDEIATMISRESGKPISYARVEVDRAVFTFSAAAEAAGHAAEGQVLDMSVAPNGVGRRGEYRFFPLGVVAAITPFNFPLNLVAHKVASAIAAGNAIVLKPAPQTPFTAFLLADILQDSGLPKGILNVLPCENDVAETLVSNPLVRMVSFTGSAPVGWKIKSLSAMARVTLELGGNGCVILDRVRNFDDLITTLTSSAFQYAGQICISLQTLYVKREYFDETLKRLIAAAAGVVTGDPLSEKTLVGPLISKQAAEKVEGWISEAVEKGATRHTGEFRAPNWITPTILTNVGHECSIYKDEAFAPVILIEPYDSLREVIALINRSAYGLQAGLFSDDINVIEQVYQDLEVGGLIVNDTNAYRLDTMPYGGVKSSGVGREGVLYAMREMSEQKLLVINA